MSFYPIYLLLLLNKNWLLCTIAVLEPPSSPDDLKQTNLLLIMYDDLRPELSIYGREHMITPNFERLAEKSVVFDYSFCQVAVCNPSRDSLMTGLRPDTVGTYNFGHSYWPHLSFPSQLVQSGYNTAGIGKIFHWESPDKKIWNFDAWDNKWYDYQAEERNFMNSSTMPDKYLPEEKFRDSLFLERALKTWDKMRAQPKPFMLGVGFKLPHLAQHVPYKYYNMYKNRQNGWKLNKRELRFPYSTPEVSYRCCAEGDFQFMREDGSRRYNRSIWLHDMINGVVPEDMHNELMMGYCASITFLDTLLGRLLDYMDQNKLWETTTVVLTADHGMHNGEKGIWEKWTLFEEATRVPLLISHPLSPYKGQHYKYPVESVDVYATLNEILKLPKTRDDACSGYKCKKLSGKSLGPVILGQELYDKHFGGATTTNPIYQKLKSLLNTKKLDGHGAVAGSGSVSPMPILNHNFAISQVIRCARKDEIPEKRMFKLDGIKKGEKITRKHIWNDCEPEKHNPDEIVLLGYAMRTPEYRYIAYFHFNRTTQYPELGLAPYEEELYNHKNETLADFTHRETVNLAVRTTFSNIKDLLRNKLVAFIKESITFGDHN